MLTQIEINGFKTFEDFSLDVKPLLIIAGANAAGKSNLFDAVRLLSRLAETDLRSAFSTLRGEPHELFRRSRSDEYARRMDLAVELLLEPTISDPWGQVQTLTHTRFRYELSVERRVDPKGLERLYVVHEAAKPLKKADDRWLRELRPSPAFGDTHLKYSRRTPLLETVRDDGRPTFKLHQDGVQGRLRPAIAAEATVLSSITTLEFRHLYAIRQELRSWRFLQLDPAALRSPASKQAPDRLEANGENLAAVLARIQAETASDDDDRGVLVEISADLASLIPGVTAVKVEEDEHNKRWELSIASRSQPPHSARVASDGTLRLLALITALSDPVHGGLICFEEPENGVHPARLGPLIGHLRSLVTDPSVRLTQSCRSTSSCSARTLLSSCPNFAMARACSSSRPELWDPTARTAVRGRGNARSIPTCSRLSSPTRLGPSSQPGKSVSTSTPPARGDPSIHRERLVRGGLDRPSLPPGTAATLDGNARRGERLRPH